MLELLFHDLRHTGNTMGAEAKKTSTGTIGSTPKTTSENRP
jgi:hypothetical protein